MYFVDAEAIAREAEGMSLLDDREEFVLELLKSLPRSQLARIHRKIGPLLLLDVIGKLPVELALRILHYLPWPDLLTCSMVSRRWHLLANDPVLWKAICDEQGWTWRRPTSMLREIERLRNPHLDEDEIPDEDEGMGGEEDEDAQHPYLAAGPSRLTQALPSYQVGSVSFSGVSLDPRKRQRLSAPSALASPSPAPLPDYKLLHQTHVRLRARVLRGAYELVVLQDRPRRSDPTTPDALGGHSATIYCLTLHTLPSGEQVLFTGSKDRTIREWDLARRRVRRVFQGGHGSSILSICAHGGFLASGGSDCVVAIWDLADGRLVTRKTDHMDSVLSVRFDDRRLVTCSKDRTVRTYHWPSLEPEHHLHGHRAAVNAAALCGRHIVTASGDRSVRLWDAESGALLHALEDHHERGIAATDVRLPFLLTGSSDEHLRLVDVRSGAGWATAPELAAAPPQPAPPTAHIPPAPGPAQMPTLLELLTRCGACGAEKPAKAPAARAAHSKLVRSVRLTDEFAVSASYDATVKVWDRASGKLVADLAGGHTGRVFAVDIDATKIVSCGEDLKICVWDISYGIDTSFITL